MALAKEIAALEAAIRRGVRSVQYDGQSVQYQSRDDMIATLRAMKREAGMMTGGSAVTYPAFEKGTE
ncbi:MAG TPA: hypothetical protein VK090_06300 [Paracoccaceae bacterium]|nr:hypothetical protein [Paracoccaceae bacterium]